MGAMDPSGPTSIAQGKSIPQGMLAELALKSRDSAARQVLPIVALTEANHRPFTRHVS